MKSNTSPRGWHFAIGACLFAQLACAVTPTPEVQKAVRAATFEVVLKKEEVDPLRYEKPLPLELIPYVIRSDHYWSIGSAFAVGPNTYVSAGHVLLSAVGSQFGSPALRDSGGHIYPVNRVLKFSAHEDYIVFTVSGAPDATVLPISEQRSIDEVVFAAGNALGEGVVIRDGLLTSETPENQDGRWKWIRFSAAASPGNSGGPLLDETGKVIGVVSAKSANENLNYALPMSLVQAGSSAKAEFDVRRSVKLPNARSAQVVTLKTDFPLPKSFPDFARAYQQVTLQATRDDLQKLQMAQADELFPKGKSAKLLASVYDSPLPTFVQQGNTDEWDVVAPENVVDQDLPDRGRVSVGTSLDLSVFRLRRPGSASDGNFYENPDQFMGLLLKGLKLPRQVGDQVIRITSLGPAQSQSADQDRYGRRWQVFRWPLGYMDQYLVCYALPVPDGYVGLVQVVPSTAVDVIDQYLRRLIDDAYVNYSGTLPQWKAFLERRSLRPALFDQVKLEFDDGRTVRYESARLQFQLPGGVVDLSADSEVTLHMAYVLNADKLSLDVGGVYLYKDHERQTYVGLERHVKPSDDSAKIQREVWDRMAVRGPGFNRIAGRDQLKSFWIHDAVSAASANNPGIDPSASVLYDVSYGTDSEIYPRDIEDTERRLVQATHVLER